MPTPSKEENKRYVVRGLAFVPVEVRMGVDAADDEKAMRIAKRKFKITRGKHRLIVPNSYDDQAVFGFDALDAAEVETNYP